jgi:ABC-2 type transport system ATP-binding protein
MTTPFVSVRDLTFDYATLRALDRVSFDIPKGAVVALVGPNGAGKTTLLRCLATLEEPLSGMIAIDGADIVKDPRAARRRVGLQQDFFGVYDGLTVGRNLRHAAAIQGLSEDEIDRAAARAAEAVELGDRLDQPAGALSRGLRQRLAVGRAIIHRPDLLLLDEPASGLDPEARHHLSDLIRRLRDDGATLIVSSHILAELEDYSTHMLSLRQGRCSGLVPIAATGGTDAAAGRWRLTFIGDPAAAEPALAAAGASDRQTMADGIEFTLAGDSALRQTLLRRLIEDGVQVTALAPVGSRMERIYLAATAAEDER